MAHQPNAVGAVGQVKVFPNSRNVIPGKVVFTVDIRSPEQGNQQRTLDIASTLGLRATSTGELRPMEQARPIQPR